MELKSKVLAILEKRRGEAVSGSAIAKQLGVSRNAVWKCVEKLREEGAPIEAATNKGYLLPCHSDSLSAEGINALLGKNIYRIKTARSVTSTNDILKAEAQKGAAEYTVLVSEQQTAGRGRLGRKFASPEKSGLYLSLILRLQMNAEDSLYITTSAAVAAAKAIDSVRAGANTSPSQIKWVNDIYIGGRKVCGILTEASINFESGQLEYAVLGIGVNFFPSEEVEKSVGEKAGYLFSSAADAPENLRNLFVARLLGELQTALLPQNFAANIDEYRKRSFLDGKEVIICAGREEFAATVIGIDDKARLIVKDRTGKEILVSTGEVSRVLVS